MKAYGYNYVYYIYWDISQYILYSSAIRPTLNIADISGLERSNYNHM